jgi:hypothetical protein
MGVKVTDIVTFSGCSGLGKIIDPN